VLSDDEPACNQGEHPGYDSGRSNPMSLPCPVCGAPLRGARATCSARCRAIRCRQRRAQARRDRDDELRVLALTARQGLDAARQANDIARQAIEAARQANEIARRANDDARPALEALERRLLTP
jgi:predicted nucleic acid-binding Zn ribbon protein